MKFRYAVVLAGLVLSAFATQASATTYHYIGNPEGIGGHVEATVDLNCVGPCAPGNSPGP